MSINVPQSLADIRTKFRKITAQPDSSQITDSEIDQYINTYYLFDFPSSLKLTSLKTTYTFYTQPNVDTYAFDTNNYYSIEPPAFIAGYPMQYLQDRATFFRTWPKLAYLQNVGTGDGVTTTFTATASGVPFLRSVNRTLQPTSTGQNPGSIPPGGAGQSAAPILPTESAPVNFQINPGNLPGSDQFREVVISSQDANGNNLTIADSGILVSANTGRLIVIQDPSSPNIGSAAGTVNYSTGAVSVTFPTAPGSGNAINLQTTPYVASRPQTILFYNNAFTLRPVPNTTYEITVNAYIKPTAFFGSSADSPASGSKVPLVSQWWQLLAMGAAKVFFSERLDVEQYQKLLPFYEEQLSFVERRTLQQLSNQRSVTIYTEQNAWPFDLYNPLF